MEEPTGAAVPAEHDHPDFTREYQIITQVMTSVKGGQREVELKLCQDCEDLSRCAVPYADAYNLAFAESGMPCTVACTLSEGKRLLQLAYEGEVFMQIDPLKGEALQYCHDDTCNQVLYHQIFR